MLIRHAEKPAGSSDGVREDGSSDKHSLIVRGWQRAGALVAFFTKPTAPDIAVPAAIFASTTTDDASLPSEEAKSLRPQETVAPLAAKLGIEVNATIAVGNEPALIALLNATDGVVLVAWEHKHIPTIAAGFIQDPPDWGDRFDAVWVLDRQAGGGYRLSVVSQSLLAGDL
jgi:broad specificity phosphatase PhoE